MKYVIMEVEESMNGGSNWIYYKPTGEVYPCEQTHVSRVIDDSELERRLVSIATKCFYKHTTKEPWLNTFIQEAKAILMGLEHKATKP